ncbi:MAG: NADAR family protein [Planctomycetota bacterium]
MHFLVLVLVLVVASAARAQDVAAPSSPSVAELASARAAFPASWFAPLPASEKAASWEITPDKAGPGEVILSKRTELGCFSNFAATPFELDGKRYASIEGLWQSLYYPEGDDDPRAKLEGWKHKRADVEQMTAFTAKRAGDDAKKILEKAGTVWMSYRGHRFEPRGSEEDRKYHLDLIARATRAKIDQNPAARDLLVKTGDLVLRPDHHPSKDATPAHYYFEILMKIRADLRTKLR